MPEPEAVEQSPENAAEATDPFESAREALIEGVQSDPPAERDSEPEDADQATDEAEDEVEGDEDGADAEDGEDEPTDEAEGEGDEEPESEEEDQDDAGGEAEEGEDDAETINADAADVLVPSHEGEEDLLVKGLPQETADTIRYHLRRSERVGELEEAVAKLSTHEQTVAFLQKNPADGLYMLARQAPGAVGEFVESWMAQNPEAAVKAWDKLALEEADAEKLALRARVAKHDTDKRIKEGLEKLSTQEQEQRYVRDTTSAIRQAVADLKLSTDDAEDFAGLAAQRLTELYQKSPTAPTRADIGTALQRVIKRFAPGAKTPRPGAATSDAKAGAKKAYRNKVRTMQDKVKLAQRAGKPGGGSAVIKALGSVRVPKGGGIEAASAALRKSAG